MYHGAARGVGRCCISLPLLIRSSDRGSGMVSSRIQQRQDCVNDALGYHFADHHLHRCCTHNPDINTVLACQKKQQCVLRKTLCSISF